jgi:YVTN family beta-propeller protein
VLNRISNTISIVDTTKNAVIGEIPVGSFDPTPVIIRNGRGFLYDAKLSGNGSASCAGCHVDSDMDHLAWDLGDPTLNMASVVQKGVTIQFHPMKGPMVTQAMRGLNNLQPYHWRGDRADLAAFNPAFNALMGGTPLSPTDMDAFTKFVNTIIFQPNPNQNLDRTLPTSIGGGDPNSGKNIFENVPMVLTLTCNTCHASTPGPGTNRLIQVSPDMSVQPMKVPQLRNTYQKHYYTKLPGVASIDGFGVENAGDFGSLFDLFSQAAFHNFRANTVAKLNLAAYVTCFDTGRAPAVGYSRTLTASNILTAPLASDLNLLQNQAATGNIDLIAKGTIQGQLHGLLYQTSTQTFVADTVNLGPYTTKQIVRRVLSGDTLTIMGVPPGSGVRMGIDRNLNGILDGDEPH